MLPRKIGRARTIHREGCLREERLFPANSAFGTMTALAVDAAVVRLPVPVVVVVLLRRRGGRVARARRRDGGGGM